MSIGAGWPSSAYASGTTAPRSSWPEYGSSNQARTPDPIEQGRRIYLRKIACAKCPVPEGATDKDTATALIERINDKEFSLSRRERDYVVSFLNRRWQLN